MKIHEYAAKIDALRMPILKETRAHNIDGRRAFSRPDAIADLMRGIIGDAVEEYMYCIAFDAGLHIIGLFECGHGSCDSAPVDVRGMIQKALLINAHSIALSHNHPSGACAPSCADLETTERVKQATEIIGIGFVDHVIVTMDSFYSFVKEGR